MRRTWIYVEKVECTKKYHVVSQGSQVRATEFWWDLRRFHDFHLTLSEDAARARLLVFQARDDSVTKLPNIWCLVEFAAKGEQDAATRGAALFRRATSFLTFATGMPFRPGGELRLVRLHHGKHGWAPHFEDGEFRAIDEFSQPPTPVEGDPEVVEYKGTRRTPGYQPVIGSARHETFVDIGFRDTIREVDRGMHVDAGAAVVKNEVVDTVLKQSGLSKEFDRLESVCSFYAAAMGQDEPAHQFVLLWSIVEVLVNSIAGTPLLQNEEVERGVEAIGREGEAKARLDGALRRVTVESFRERIESSFSETFGECQEGAAKQLAGLRRLRGKLLHPHSADEGWDAELVTGLRELQTTIEAHIRGARTRCFESQSE